MTVPHGPPSVSYLPGGWVALAAEDIILLAEIPMSGSLVTACWDSVTHGAGVDGLLGVIAREGLRTVPNFALVGPSGDGGVRLLVSGKAQAEVSAPGRSEPMVVSAAESTTWLEQRLPGRPALRLVAGTGEIPAATALPLIAGVVLASAIAVGVAAVPAQAHAPAGLAAPPLPPTVETPAVRVPAPVPPISSDTMPPRSDFDSGLIDSLPWRTPETFLGEPAEPQPAEPAEPQQAASPMSSQPAAVPPAWPEPGPARPAWPQPVWPDPGAPQAAWPEPQPEHPIQPVRPQPAPHVPVADPANPWAPGGAGAVPAADPSPPADDVPVTPVVHAVACPRRHLNPPYANTCRICDEVIPPQEGFAAPRPSLGVLRLSTGATVPLDRDVVLGRAPFHADETPASRPHLVQLASPGNDISRSHARVSLENWFVQVTDLGSTNGTVVTLPGQAPVRLRAHDPFTILPGSTVNIADEVTLRYEVSSR